MKTADRNTWLRQAPARATSPATSVRLDFPPSDLLSLRKAVRRWGPPTDRSPLRPPGDGRGGYVVTLRSRRGFGQHYKA